MIKYNPFIKRSLDVFFSSMAIIFFTPLIIPISILICIDSKGSPFFIQERFGRKLVPFRLIKFRSMAAEGIGGNDGFSPGDRRRVTKIGSILRKTKIDELPELFNILKGDMSFVGPRPEVAEYVYAYFNYFEAILVVRPGLTDFASIKYRNEEEILSDKNDPEKYYRHVILPDKLELARNYVDNISLKLDMSIIRDTLGAVISVTNSKNSETTLSKTLID